jgi:hypothetical protein
MPENSIEPGTVSLRNLSISAVQQSSRLMHSPRVVKMIGVAATQHQIMSGLMTLQGDRARRHRDRAGDQAAAGRDAGQSAGARLAVAAAA